MSVRLQGMVTCRETGRGLSEVLVSNGEQVGKTGQDGSYHLTAEAGVHRFVWLSQPAGYRADGPWYNPVPTVDGDVDFQLAPAPERSVSSFRFVHVTDTHVCEHRTPPGVYREAIYDVVEQTEPAFIVHGGDLTNRGTIAEFESYQLAIQGIQTPIFPLFGNHDGEANRVDADGKDITNTTNFNQVIGPAYFSFDWGPIHVCLYADFNTYFSEADRKRRPDWLRADLEAQPAGRVSVLVVHQPPSDEFVADMNLLGVAVILCGHLHANKGYSYKGTAVLATSPFCFGGVDTSPSSYRVLHVANKTIASRLRASQSRRLKPCEPDALRLGSRRLDLVWSAGLAGNLHRASPVVAGDRIYVSQRDEDLTGGPGVVCLDVATGQSQWETSTEAAVKNRVAVDEDGHCAVFGVAGQLLLLDADSGQIRWRCDLPQYPQRWLFGSPVIDRGHVYGGARGGYGAWRVETGEQVWYTQLERTDSHTCYAVPVITDELLINVVQTSGAIALRRDTGEIVWRRQEQSVNYTAASPALVDGDRVILPGKERQLLCLRADTGEEIWHIEPEKGVVLGLTVCADRILLSTESDGAQCIDADTGEQVWRYETGPDLMDAYPYQRSAATLMAAPACWESYALIGGNDGVLYVLDAASGECAAQLFVGAPITAAPCVLADGFCVPAWDGRLMRYAVRD